MICMRINWFIANLNRRRWTRQPIKNYWDVRKNGYRSFSQIFDSTYNLQSLSVFDLVWCSRIKVNRSFEGKLEWKRVYWGNSLNLPHLLIECIKKAQIYCAMTVWSYNVTVWLRWKFTQIDDGLKFEDNFKSLKEEKFDKYDLQVVTAVNEYVYSDELPHTPLTKAHKVVKKGFVKEGIDE